MYRLADADQPWVGTGELANALALSPGTVTSMLKSLHAKGLVEYQAYRGAKLTSAGELIALRILRRHRLLESFLARVLDLGWDEVHDDAERMEHVVSDFLIERIDSYLGRPRFDPHGDPIPCPNGEIVERRAQPLSSLPIGSDFTLVHVLDQTADFLQYLDSCGLELGTTGTVSARNQPARTVSVKLESGEYTFSLSTASQLMVTTGEP
ncbi:MAG: metal-dependent transcriptional regulator [Planctomycetota bacterium]|nr:MAG: metal-dependent transcriptional regulator [Planctomycetota bacterium]